MTDKLPADVAFSGTVRLFPLPNLVMFPHVMQPLHVFEPRFCELLEEAMATDRMIGMVLLAPGWERDYEGRPPIEKVACLTRVVTHERRSDGRHNILIQGLARVGLVEELPPSKPFREARAELLTDRNAEITSRQRALEQQLVDLCRTADPHQARSPFIELLEKDSQLGTITDLIASALELTLATRQQLLAELDVVRRAELLIERLEVGLRSAEPLRDFPPPFSVN